MLIGCLTKFEESKNKVCLGDGCFMQANVIAVVITVATGGSLVLNKYQIVGVCAACLFLHGLINSLSVRRASCVHICVCVRMW